MPFHAEVLFGSAMHLLVHCIMPGEPAENLATLWLWIKDKYVEFGTKVRFGTMKMTMFSAGGGAKLRGTASQIRCIGPVLHSLWKEVCKSNLRVYKQVELCLRTSVHLEQILDENKEEFALKGDVADDFEATAWMHYDVFWELREHFRKEKMQLFQLTQKGHSAMHAALLCRSWNPRFSWCFGAESWMATGRRLALACAKASGNGNGVATTRLLIKTWLLAMHYTMQEPEKWAWRGQR